LEERDGSSGETRFGRGARLNAIFGMAALSGSRTGA
jgi:hypothetical protein